MTIHKLTNFSGRLFPHVMALAVAIGGVACSGSSNKGAPTATAIAPGNTHLTGNSQQAGDGDAGIADDDIEDVVQVTPPEDTTSSTPTVTLIVVNSAGSDLVLNMDKGWAGVFSAWRGESPNARSILPFPTHCTASCDAAEPCPSCPEPKTANAIRAAEKQDHVAANDKRTIVWDGVSFKYKRKKRGCDCYEAGPPPAGEYRFEACGLRLTQSAKSRSEYPCVQSKELITLPLEESVVIEFDFAK